MLIKRPLLQNMSLIAYSIKMTVKKSFQLNAKTLFIICSCIIFVLFHLVYNFHQGRNFFKLPGQMSRPYRINTKMCKIIDLPLYNQETDWVFKKLRANKIPKIECKRKFQIKIYRFDETSIQLNWTEVGYKPFCYYRQLSRGLNDFYVKFGKFLT